MFHAVCCLLAAACCMLLTGCCMLITGCCKDKFPFRRLIAAYLKVPEDQMDSLHQLPFDQATAALHPKLVRACKEARVPVSEQGSRSEESSVKRELLYGSAFESFIEVYRQFVAEVIAPTALPACSDNSKRVLLNGSPTEGESRGGAGEDASKCVAGIAFQSPPTLRVVMPDAKPTISLHCDRHYAGHQSAEINYWLPLTSVYKSNTLWLESEPQKGDFRPMTLGYGQVLRFNGYECRHYTVHNHTPVSVELYRVNDVFGSCALSSACGGGM